MWQIIEDHLDDRFKEYGRACAEKALADAAERADVECEYSNPYDSSSMYWIVDKKSILETQILTP